jgi:hypothetical protein
VSSSQSVHNLAIIMTDFSLTGHCLIVRFQISNIYVVVVKKSPGYATSRFLRKLKDMLQIIGNNVVVGDFDLQKTEAKMLYGFSAYSDCSPSSTRNTCLLFHKLEDGREHGSSQ